MPSTGSRSSTLCLRRRSTPARSHPPGSRGPAPRLCAADSPADAPPRRRSLSPRPLSLNASFSPRRLNTRPSGSRSNHGPAGERAGDAGGRGGGAASRRHKAPRSATVHAFTCSQPLQHDRVDSPRRFAEQILAEAREHDAAYGVLAPESRSGGLSPSLPACAAPAGAA